jgi:hypothetical protein
MFSRLIVAGILLLAAPAAAYYKPLNPHRRPKAATAPQAPKNRLAPGRWDPDVAEALDKAVELHGSGAAGYDAASPPIAVMALEGVLVENDPAELVFDDLVRKAQFKFDDDFWRIVPITYGRQRIRAAYKQFSVLPKAIWDEQPTYQQYVKYFIASYQDMCAHVSRKDCRMYLARLWRGFSDQEAVEYSRKVLDDEARRPPAEEKIGVSPQDLSPVIIHHGFAPAPETMDLARLLGKTGFQLWLAQPDPQPVLEAAAAQLGLSQANLLGIKQDVVKDRFTGRAREPVPVRGGAVEAFVSLAGRPPTIAAGAGVGDLDLLSYGDGPRLMISGDSELLRLARARHWSAQKEFGMIRTRAEAETAPSNKQ